MNPFKICMNQYRREMKIGEDVCCYIFTDLF